MAKVERGRFTAGLDEVEHADLVVFLIGMRINKLRAPAAWLPVLSAMPKMVAELQRRPELGLLHATSFLSGRTALLTQWWRSFDHLDAYAKAGEELHLPAWRAFNRRARSSDAVGVFHETYIVGATRSESVYVNMPVMGLARATSHLPAAARGMSAAHRMDRTMPDVVTVDP